MFTTPTDKWEISTLPQNVTLDQLKDDQKAANLYMIPHETKANEKLLDLYAFFNYKAYEEQAEWAKYMNYKIAANYYEYVSIQTDIFKKLE